MQNPSSDPASQQQGSAPPAAPSTPAPASGGTNPPPSGQTTGGGVNPPALAPALPPVVTSTTTADPKAGSEITLESIVDSLGSFSIKELETLKIEALSKLKSKKVQSGSGASTEKISQENKSGDRDAQSDTASCSSAGISLKDINTATDLVSKMQHQWHIDSNAFDISACLDALKKFIDTTKRRNKKSTLLLLLGQAMPQFEAWQKTHDCKSMTVNQLLDALRNEFCSQEKLYNALVDSKSTYFNMKTSETIEEFLTRIFLCLEKVESLGNELSDKFLKGLEGVVNKETYDYFVEFLPTLHLQTPGSGKPSPELLKRDYQSIKAILSDEYLQSTAHTDKLLNPHVKVEEAQSSKKRKGNTSDIDVNTLGAMEGKQPNKKQELEPKPPCPLCIQLGHPERALSHSIDKCRFVQEIGNKKPRTQFRKQSQQPTNQQQSKRKQPDTGFSDTPKRCAKCFKMHRTEDCIASQATIEAIKAAQEAARRPQSLPAPPISAPLQQMFPHQMSYGTGMMPQTLYPPPILPPYNWCGALSANQLQNQIPVTRQVVGDKDRNSGLIDNTSEETTTGR